MKRLIVWLLIVMLMLLVTACDMHQITEKEKLPPSVDTPEKDIQENPGENKEFQWQVSLTEKYILKGWDGAYDRERCKETILAYQESKEPFSFSQSPDYPYATFGVDYEPKSACVLSVSHIADTPEEEWNNCLDTATSVRIDGNLLTVSTGWWYGSSGWVREFPIWAYTIEVTDVDGGTHYYYFRLDYSKNSADISDLE